ncbi:hypothetical protein HWV62_6128 [Athelia sp. TMB]|nr:hypothetical protein HWV62_6128 [Athelia sp. TMB]
MCSSAFGIKSQAPASTSLFGQSNAAKPSIFGTTQPASTGFGAAQGSIFGGGQQQQQQAAPSTGLFGQPAGQQAAPSTGLFGQPATQQNQQPATGLFGQPAASTQQQQPQTNAFGSSLFGSTNNNNQNTQQQGQGLFGSTNNNQQQQQPNQSTFGGWGSNTANTNALQPQATVPAGSNAWGSSLLGQQNKPQTASSTQPSGPPLFTRATKFNDLPDHVKKSFEDIEAHIQGRLQISSDLKQRKLGEEPTKGQELIYGVHKDLVNTTSIVQSDAIFTKDIKAKADQAVEDTIVATRIVDGFRNPQQHGAYLKNHASFPLEFFNRITEQMRERLHWYKNTIEQIEHRLSSSATQAQTTPQAISQTLQAQHATFINLASKTAYLDAELKKIKTLYTQLWRAKTGSMRDPFNDLDKNRGDDLGLDALHVK